MTTLSEVHRARQVRKILARQLRPAETKVVVDVLGCEQNGGTYHAGKLGIAESLCRRGWLIRTADGALVLSEQTRALLQELTP